MNLPDTLAGRLRLLAFQPDSGRPAGYLDLDFALHAAALTDLLLRGLLVDRIGLAERRGAVSARLAPELQGILCGSALAQRQSARWDVLIERPAGTTAIGRAIDERLREGGFVRFAEDRGAGRFPALRPFLCDEAAREQLAGAVEAALAGPIDDVQPWQAALVVLAAECGIRTALSCARRRAERARLTELRALVPSPVLLALRRVVRERRKRD
ncbi:GPP34 family phosphoprotein [Kitasatospora sp. NBC_01250]|uniref:GPP34 family phosphoprotein n=1 Tax=unclassified Kitasatospora TaxID=2633591 RepID=UPI002E1147D7|nr:MULTISPECIES: GPP34 family phosphoprotein [unclassified Kitasatospora]WSJ65503.1 GPP34 family phosphoprotein [Kitasatospora sp. NBC_01302]